MKTIVAGLDFTDSSRGALREALHLCDSRGSVHVVHVVDRSALEEIHATTGHSRGEFENKVLLDTKRLMQAYIAEREANLPDREGVTLIVEVRVGEPAEVLAEYAASAGAELIVLARNSRSNPKRGAGTSAVQTVRFAQCNVLVVHGGQSARPRNVAACVDFSEHSERAVRTAAEIVKREGATLHLAHAYRPFWEVVHFGALPIDATAEVQNEQRQLLEQRLARLAKAATELAGSEVPWHIVPAGSTAGALLDALEDIRADLAVVASHGRTGLSRVLLGSIAERLVRDSPCSILVCKVKLGRQ